MDAEKAINEILDDLEHQPLQKSRTFMAYLNAPELVSLSSTNATPQSAPISSQTDNSYFNFQVNLPRPAINVKSLQLLKAIIPQAQTSIPDYSLVFPYYRCACVPLNANGVLYFLEDPNITTLNYIRLIPSSTKPEIIDLSANVVTGSYGYNRTFADYEELLSELNKACAIDPAPLSGHYIANDVSFEYNQQQNKFVFVGNNVSEPNVFEFWDENTSYTNGDIVNYEGIDYICIQNTEGSGNDPPNVAPDYWRNISQYYEAQPKFNAYLIAGYNDPNVQTLLQTLQTQTTAFDQPRVTSVPGNKYVSGQTLARRLGFTWDGTGMINNIDLENLLNLTYGGSQPLFYNRLRPIPQYPYTIPEFLEALTLSNGNVNNKYTADGYCNLVYSSIINIYTTIIGTSSVDTQRNANLLGTIEMACGNLGIAFGNNYIDTKLTKIQTDIYSIYIELRDENGQPYYLTNNATSTFLLKLTYLE